MSTEDRLIDLETRITGQEDQIDALNRIVYAQQTKIDELEALCTALARRIKETREAINEAGPSNEKPPHY